MLLYYAVGIRDFHIIMQFITLHNRFNTCLYGYEKWCLILMEEYVAFENKLVRKTGGPNKNGRSKGKGKRCPCALTEHHALKA